MMKKSIETFIYGYHSLSGRIWKTRRFAKNADKDKKSFRYKGKNRKAVLEGGGGGMSGGKWEI